MSNRKQQNDALMVQIKEIHENSRGTYGLPRIKKELQNRGESCGNERIGRLMNLAGVSGLQKRRYKVKTTDSNHTSPIAARVFKIEDVVTHPIKANQVWASDITYIPTEEGFLYLATYLDLYTRKVVGFAMSEDMRTELILTALDMALGRQLLITGELVNHSDRGSQYASESFRNKLAELGVTASMSRKGNCYDNAYAESFFATLKKELIYKTSFKTKEEAKQVIFEYIEVWYNRKRLHSSIGYMTPVQFEESLVA